ncbi:MAG: hypothetical protein DHS20C18_33920 [Saprospiraceae bacterium]|nr:MAG: hypothetical protein DHS20C18_33920 [Saprospiraceae bacterium]
MKHLNNIIIAVLFISIYGCGDEHGKAVVSDPQFQLLTQEETGLNFENVLNSSTDFNVFNYMYFFNGGGVAVGDFNNDDLPDLYFTSNMGPNSLFLNQGDLKFKEVTEEAGVAGLNGWTAGVSVVDINNDGLLDIYVSQMGDYLNMKGHNQLYVCQGIENGIPVYEDQAAFYGLDFVGFATQSAFFDYDLDGDLDMYQLNHSLHQNGTFGRRKTFEEIHPTSGDKLFRNDDGRFKDVTKESGIISTVIGYGLGIATSDINLDGWPDIYIGNDFHENDYLYLNQQDGTFKEVLAEQLQHTSRFSMGVDIADINNDGLNEIFSLDMLPTDPFILKSSLGEDGYNIYQFKLGYGYNHQFARNNLQLNNGNGTFSEIGMFSGVYATDWSWAPLFMDFDHDGNRDIFISNGIPRRMNDIDYIKFRLSDEDLDWKSENNHILDKDLQIIETMPQVKLANCFLRNKGDLTFEDICDQVNGSTTSFSNGAVYADLDNDGDLDVVVNNLEDPPFVYKNQTIEKQLPNRNYLDLQLTGSPKNINAIGARLVVFRGKERLVEELFPVRGYQSSVQMGFNLGIGSVEGIDSIVLIWPDLGYQNLPLDKYNQRQMITWEAGLPKFDFQVLKPHTQSTYDFMEVTGKSGLNFTHKENPFVDFNREALIPNMVSAEGPAIAVGDVNGDGLEDVFFGSSKFKRSQLYFQRKNGTFYENTPAVIVADSIFEDVSAVFADLENDGDLDLVIASGGNEFKGKAEALRQRAYINDGKGGLTLNMTLFGEITMTASCVLASDFNQDGLVDFFFGGRAVPWKYGEIPDSYLFENKGNGQFEEVTEKYAPDLQKPGMVKGGTWYDMDQDGDQDLLLAVEWAPIQVYLNQGGRFEKKEIGEETGWWNFVFPYDFDQDGDVDLLAGNFGKNARFNPTKEKPVKLYVNDYDNNGQIEQILTFHMGGREIPFANYEELTRQMPGLKKKFLFAKDLAAASLEEIFGKDKLTAADVFQATTLSSMYYENTGDGLAFTAHKLPDKLQLTTLNTAYLADFNGDGSQEVMLGENFYHCNIEMGRYDAGYGNILSIGKNGTFDVQPVGQLSIRGQVQAIQPVAVGVDNYIIVVKNDAPVEIIRAVKNPELTMK